MMTIRRGSMNAWVAGAVACLAGLMCCSPPASGQQPASRPARDPNAARELGWTLSVQAWTFRHYTFFEAIDKAAALGMDGIEMYPGQRLSEEHPDIRTGHEMTGPQRELVRRKLAQAGVKLVGYGVVGLDKDAEVSRPVFEFAKQMGIGVIVSEPAFDALNTVDRLARRYRIKVALHNHPRPTRYWNPRTVVQACKGRSIYLGACADTGHWMRSGVRPAEALKLLAGRVAHVHLKDLNRFDTLFAHDVPWGTGKGDVKAMLAELKRQGYRGAISAEYEHNWTRSMPDLARCVAAFDRLTAALSP